MKYKDKGVDEAADIQDALRREVRENDYQENRKEEGENPEYLVAIHGDYYSITKCGSWMWNRQIISRGSTGRSDGADSRHCRAVVLVCPSTVQLSNTSGSRKCRNIKVC